MSHSKDQDLSCPALLQRKSKCRREKSCKFLRCNCSYPACVPNWMESLEDIVSHMMSHQCVHICEGNEAVFYACNINNPENIQWTLLLIYLGKHFIFTLQKKENHFLCNLQMVGTDQNTQKFKYRVSLCTQKQVPLWEPIYLSAYEEAESAIVESAGFVFDMEIAQKLMENEKLCIYIKIEQF